MAQRESLERGHSVRIIIIEQRAYWLVCTCILPRQHNSQWTCELAKRIAASGALLDDVLHTRSRCAIGVAAGLSIRCQCPVSVSTLVLAADDDTLRVRAPFRKYTARFKDSRAHCITEDSAMWLSHSLIANTIGGDFLRIVPGPAQVPGSHQHPRSG